MGPSGGGDELERLLIVERRLEEDLSRAREEADGLVTDAHASVDAARRAFEAELATELERLREASRAELEERLREVEERERAGLEELESVAEERLALLAEHVVSTLLDGAGETTRSEVEGSP